MTVTLELGHLPDRCREFDEDGALRLPFRAHLGSVSNS